MPVTSYTRVPSSAVSTVTSPAASASTRFLRIPANYKRVEFAPTPVMSTYLLAWIIGEFDYASSTMANGCQIRVYTPIGKTHLAAFAIDVASRCLAFYNDYFGIPCKRSVFTFVCLSTSTSAVSCFHVCGCVGLCVGVCVWCM